MKPKMKNQIVKIQIKNKIFFISSFPALLFVLMFLAPSCKVKKPTEQIVKRIDMAVDKACNWLSTKYSSESILDDPYYQCIDQSEGCDKFYRKLDAAMYFAYTIDEKDILKHPKLKTFVDASQQLVDKIYADWSKEPVGSKAIETFSAFAYYNHNEKMLEEIAKAYRPEYSGWIAPNTYSKPWAWRKIYDEAWPLLTLAKYKAHRNITDSVIKNHLKIAMDILEGNSIHPASDGVIVYDVFYELLKLKKEGYDISPYQNVYLKLEQHYSNNLKKMISLGKNPVSAASQIILILNFDLPFKEFLKDFFEIIISTQEKEGYWRASNLKPGEKTSRGTLVTEKNKDSLLTTSTLSCIIALTKYKKFILQQQKAN